MVEGGISCEVLGFIANGSSWLVSSFPSLAFCHDERGLPRKTQVRSAPFSRNWVTPKTDRTVMAGSRNKNKNRDFLFLRRHRNFSAELYRLSKTSASWQWTLRSNNEPGILFQEEKSWETICVVGLFWSGDFCPKKQFASRQKIKLQSWRATWNWYLQF